MKLNKDDLYWTNKKHTTYAVLVSPGFGAAWSTAYGTPLAYDKRIVKYIIEHQKDKKRWESDWSPIYGPGMCKGEAEFRKFLAGIGYDADAICYLGVREISVRKVEVDFKWCITAHDGWEELHVLDIDDSWNFCG